MVSALSFRFNTRTPFSALTLIVAVCALACFIFTPGGSAQSSGTTLSFERPLTNSNNSAASLRLEDTGSGAFLTTWKDGERVCEVAPETVSRQLSLLPANVIRLNHNSASELMAEQQQAPPSSLKIILRGTAQLEGFPDAKQAFLKAASIWESLISTPMQIIVDVDFGPENFGRPFSNENVIGSTSSQIVGDSNAYPDVRGALMKLTSSPAVASTISRLPADSMPTDIGSKRGIDAPAALFRALGLIDPVANPDTETEDLGNPPKIGFNSAFSFDFNPADGIDSNKLDFQGTALHELGHALGFISSVDKSVTPTCTTSPSTRPSIWDVFRFRPGIDDGSFSTASRVLQLGGDQVFFAGKNTLELSTGNGNATCGDKRQASHWKDDSFTGRYIGIMDPTARAGDHDEITENDLHALASMGYQIRSIDSVPTVELKADDGVVDSGLRGSGAIMVTRLTPPSYPARLETIRIYFAPFQNLPDPSGAAIRLVAFAGGPGSTSPPNSPNLLVNRWVPLPTVTIQTGFVDFKITNGPVITEGDFYVGFQAPNPALGVVFALDDDEPLNDRSFSSIDNGQTYQGPLTLGSPAKRYNAMIRALVSTDRGVRVESAYGRAGDLIDVPITLLAKGNENSAASTLVFNPAILDPVGIDPGESGITLSSAGSGASGHFGVTATAPGNQTFSAGRHRLIVMHFRIVAGAVPGTTMISLEDSPTARRISGPGQTNLTEGSTFVGAMIAVAGKTTAASAASFVPDILAPDSMAVAFGAKFSPVQASSNTVPLASGLAGTTLRITDSKGVEHLAQLFFMSAGQVNFLVPALAAEGSATITIASADGNISTGGVQIANVAPGLFSANSSGRDVASGFALRVRGTQQINEQISRLDTGTNSFVPVAIDLGPASDQIFLVLFGTGFKKHTGAATATVGGVSVQAAYAGEVMGFVGLDQANIGPIPRSLAARGNVEVVLNVDGKETNRVTVNFR